MRKYNVARRGPIVEKIRESLEKSGAEVVSTPDPQKAPFEFRIRTPQGEELHLICYAFLANKYRQQGRPENEHRFQIKYGSEFDQYHEIFIDPNRKLITLMFGVHLEEDLFVAVDPSMHNPTWFSKSIEFKSEDLNVAQASGWHGWERDRSEGRRKEVPPLASNQTEVLAGFKPENFLRYVQFERLTTGLDAGERLLMLENVAAHSPGHSYEHVLEKQFGLSAHEILNVIGRAFRLEAAVRGHVAQYHLGEYLKAVPKIDDVQPIDKDGKPDFRVVYQGNPYHIECKNVLRKQTSRGPRVDFQKTRASKNDPCSRYYERDAFDVLAACLHPITENWEFRFCPTSMLNPHPKCEGRLSHRVDVIGDIWTKDIAGSF